MGQRIWSLIELLFGIIVVVSCIVLLMTSPRTGGEFVAYSDVRKMGFWMLGIGVVAGAALYHGIRGLLRP